MKRIYYPHEVTNTNIITGAEQHYIKNVLRLDAGSLIELLTPAGLAVVELADVGKREITATLQSMRPLSLLDYSFTVFQCVLKREYMDTVMEKYTELGVTRIVPVASARSVGDVKDSTLTRYREIAKAAALQSERDQLPEITELIKIKQIPAEPEAESFLFYEREVQKSKPQISGRNLRMIIGPEGGFTDEEVALLTQQGFQCVSPLENILKAETAAVVFAGWLRIELG
ncbi:MAG: 16S rRNA (uracil(1498)-N(3))-methyltransferase [Deferribacteraceae bacterium]|jgi:16S rRNA (uracil1498-N3)-methyltransferase|nr:16S rRNA (uracil(1498)-N(3))-methyltransferase [Deferribacteraceae bacterium]